jgi:hypothetical protein
LIRKSKRKLSSEHRRESKDMRPIERAITTRSSSLSSPPLLRSKIFRRKRSCREEKRRRWRDFRNSRAMETWSRAITSLAFQRRSS